MLVHVNQVNHTSLVAVVTPTDRPKSVSNRCVIERFPWHCCMLSLCPFDMSVGVGLWAFVIGLSRIFFFLSWNVMPKTTEQADAKRDGVISPHNYNFN